MRSKISCENLIFELFWRIIFLMLFTEFFDRARFFVFLTIIMLALPPSALALENPFVDIPEDYEFVQALDNLKNRGVIKGFPDQTFVPDKPISRAEFLKIVMVSSGVKPKEKADDPGFKDVLTEDWFYEFVRDAKATGLVKGFDDATFRPHQGVTRAEALKMLFQAYNVKPEFSGDSGAGGIDADGSGTLTGEMTVIFPPDITVSDWFFSFAGAARQRWIMTDYDDGLFRPHQTLTRGSAAEVLYRFDTVYKNNLPMFDIATEWENFQSASGGFSLKKPRSWSVIPETTRTVFWKEDPLFPHQDYAFTTPLSAKLIVRHPVSVSQNSGDAYYEEVKKFSESLFGKDAVRFSEVMIPGQPSGSLALRVSVLSKNLENWYFYAENQKVFIFYSEFGPGSLSQKFQNTISSMMRTVQFQSPLPDANKKEFETLMSHIQENILIESKGKTTLELLPDKMILETDEIGVGTGPVDYYFSAKFNLTLKYERVSDMILAIRASRTTKF